MLTASEKTQMAKLLRRLSWRDLRQMSFEGEQSAHDSDEEEVQLEKIKELLCAAIRSISSQDLYDLDKPKAEGKKKEDDPKGVKKKDVKSNPSAAAKAGALAWVKKKRESEKKACSDSLRARRSSERLSARCCPLQSEPSSIHEASYSECLPGFFSFFFFAGSGRSAGGSAISSSAPDLYGIIQRKFKFERLEIETCNRWDIQGYLDEIRTLKPRQIGKKKWQFQGEDGSRRNYAFDPETRLFYRLASGTLTIMWNSLYGQQPASIELPLEDDLQWFHSLTREFHTGNHGPRNHSIGVPSVLCVDSSRLDDYSRLGCKLVPELGQPQRSPRSRDIIVKAAYRKMILLVHPDKNAGSERSELATKALREIWESRHTLSARGWGVFCQRHWVWTPEKQFLEAEARVKELQAAGGSTSNSGGQAGSAEASSSGGGVGSNHGEGRVKLAHPRPPVVGATPTMQTRRGRQAPMRRALRTTAEEDFEQGGEGFEHGEEGGSPPRQTDPEALTVRWEPVNVQALDEALNLDAVRRFHAFGLYDVLHSIRLRARHIKKGKVGWVCVAEEEGKALQRYLDQRDALLGEVCYAFGVKRDQAKHLFIALGFGGSVSNWCSDVLGYIPEDDDPMAGELMKTLQCFQTDFTEAQRAWFKDRSDASAAFSKYEDMERRFLDILIEEASQNVLDAAGRAGVAVACKELPNPWEFASQEFSEYDWHVVARMPYRAFSELRKVVSRYALQGEREVRANTADLVRYRQRQGFWVERHGEYLHRQIQEVLKQINRHPLARTWTPPKPFNRVDFAHGLVSSVLGYLGERTMPSLDGARANGLLLRRDGYLLDFTETATHRRRRARPSDRLGFVAKALSDIWQPKNPELPR
ncbi:unnamed protein product, partial [Symbiodinium microadriaticum]